MKQKGHLYFSLFLLVVSGYAIYVASGWSFKTGFFPLQCFDLAFFVINLRRLGRQEHLDPGGARVEKVDRLVG